MSMKRIPIPEQKEWIDIYYHPEPIITIMKGYEEDKYWKEQIPGCKIEAVPDERSGFLMNLSSGVKIKVIYPDDWKEHYVEPLATIHTQFWMYAMSELIYGIYPFPSHNNKKKFHIGGKVNKIVSDFYWDNSVGDSYKKYTPETWVNFLNKIMDYVENNPVKDEFYLEEFRLGLLENLKELEC